MWRRGSKHPTRSVILTEDFNKPGPDSKAYLGEVLTSYPVPSEFEELIEKGENGMLDELARMYPAPTQD